MGDFLTNPRVERQVGSGEHVSNLLMDRLCLTGRYMSLRASEVVTGRARRCDERTKT